METLAIKKINTTITNYLVRIGDLVYFDGPLLTLFEDLRNGHLYLFDWVDRDNTCNRWLVYRVSPDALFSFISKQITHFDLFKSNPDNKFYTTDIAAKYKFTDYSLSELEEVSSKYLPNNDSYFDEADCPVLSKIKALAERAISRKKQDNEYFPSENFRLSLAPISIEWKGSNRINPSYYEEIRNSSVLLIKFSIDIKIDSLHRYNTMGSTNSNVNLPPRILKRNKMYA